VRNERSEGLKRSEAEGLGWRERSRGWERKGGARNMGDADAGGTASRAQNAPHLWPFPSLTRHSLSLSRLFPNQLCSKLNLLLALR
jgi:hypothetical protein